MWCLVVWFVASLLAGALFMAALIVGKRADRDNEDCR
jgi:hypothetical protein